MVHWPVRGRQELDHQRHVPAGNRRMAAASNGWLGGIRTALKTVIERCDANTKVVPGLGAVVNVDALQKQEELSAPAGRAQIR